MGGPPNPLIFKIRNICLKAVSTYFFVRFVSTYIDVLALPQICPDSSFEVIGYEILALLSKVKIINFTKTYKVWQDSSFSVSNASLWTRFWVNLSQLPRVFAYILATQLSNGTYFSQLSKVFAYILAPQKCSMEQLFPNYVHLLRCKYIGEHPW